MCGTRPACGSGHFIVSVFLMLVPLRMQLEGLSAREAVDAVLSQNIHGLEIDSRCVELAAFALAMAAWNYPGAGGYRPLPELHIACSGLSVSVAKEEWKALALDKRELGIGLGWMYDTFQNAPVLGSLINPSKSPLPPAVEWKDVANYIITALGKEVNEETYEVGIVAQGLAKATTMLAGRYTWVVTNVPYLARGKQSEKLAAFCEEHYPEGKNDLATVFLDRCLEFCDNNGSTSIVLPQNWLFLTTYKKFREKLLRREQWNLIARLGSGAFETISGEVVKAILISISKGSTSFSGGLFGEQKPQFIRGIDVSEAPNAAAKAEALVAGDLKSLEQGRQLENPDARVAFEDVQGELLEKYSDSYWGLGSGDYPRFGRFFWERVIPNVDWIFQLSTILTTSHFGAREHILFWQEGKGEIVNSPGAYVRGTQIWGKIGIHVSQMRELPVTYYSGECWDSNSAPIIPKNVNDLPAIWCYCSSPEYNESVRQIDQALKVTNATLVKVPFDLAHWQKVAAEKYPHGLPKPYTNDPTQWIFHGHPCGSVIWSEETKKTEHGALRKDATVLQIAVARMLGYQWPAESTRGFQPLSPSLTESAEKDQCRDGIGTMGEDQCRDGTGTIGEGQCRDGIGTMELAPQQREWVTKCTTLSAFADNDGIICIPTVRGEQSAVDRLLGLLRAAYETEWNQNVLSELLTAADYAGKSLEAWLRNGFFEQHCKLFANRPFIWQIWDGLPDGFSALVNYHKLDTKLLESLIYTYLGDWITAHKAEGSEEKVAAAEALKKRLELILEGEAPYDIFVRWKPLDQQPVGWNPDLNDGVRLNIRPFLSVLDIKVKGAGVLRNKVKVDWSKDRGKDVESAPWFKVFNGDRINDYHLGLEEKRKAG